MLILSAELTRHELLIDTKGNEAANMLGIAGSRYPLVISSFTTDPAVATVTDCSSSKA